MITNQADEAQIHGALKEFRRELQQMSYGAIGLKFVIHDGVIVRIETEKLLSTKVPTNSAIRSIHE